MAPHVAPAGHRVNGQPVERTPVPATSARECRPPSARPFLSTGQSPVAHPLRLLKSWRSRSHRPAKAHKERRREIQPRGQTDPIRDIMMQMHATFFTGSDAPARRTSEPRTPAHHRAPASQAAPAEAAQRIAVSEKAHANSRESATRAPRAHANQMPVAHHDGRGETSNSAHPAQAGRRPVAHHDDAPSRRNLEFRAPALKQAGGR